MYDQKIRINAKLANVFCKLITTVAKLIKCFLCKIKARYKKGYTKYKNFVNYSDQKVVNSKVKSRGGRSVKKLPRNNKKIKKFLRRCFN